MSNPSTIKSLLESCTYRNSAVLCPNKKLLTNILAAKWLKNDSQWTPWTVIDCSLLPAGQMDCEMSCLSQLREITH
jgi:hypothetical protein